MYHYIYICNCIILQNGYIRILYQQFWSTVAVCPSCSCTRHPGHSLPPGAVHCASISSEIIISCALKALKKFVENPWKNIP